ncbi:SnoaL-like domain-containing protein [uncultured Fibrella sp.]|uniref:SnoaL-like domain-containing protein n=1 Tax=uncultured Fibrella sp. TaxID=1284596 RepID=UPI0035CB278F
MTIQEIASRLHTLCSQGKFEDAQNELYAADATSAEPDRTHTIQTVHGLEAIIEKGRHFQSMIEAVHGGSTGDPKVFGNTIFMELRMDVTMKGMGRMDMNEMCKYEVKDGKIISEEFFF